MFHFIGGPLMHKEGNKMVIIGTVSGGGWTCTGPYKGIASPWGPNYDIVDQRWNSVSAHMGWISKIITGSDVDLCKPGKPKPWWASLV